MPLFQSTEHPAAFLSISAALLPELPNQTKKKTEPSQHDLQKCLAEKRVNIKIKLEK